MIAPSLHEPDEVRERRYKPASVWWNGAQRNELYRFANGFGAVVTDASEYGPPNARLTVKLVKFSGPLLSEWDPVDFFRSHLSRKQADEVLRMIEDDKIEVMKSTQ